MASWDEYAIQQTLRKEGLEQGILKGKAEVVKNLIVKMGMTDAQVTELLKCL